MKFSASSFGYPPTCRPFFLPGIAPIADEWAQLIFQMLNLGGCCRFITSFILTLRYDDGGDLSLV
jgi:hypothetical protein